MYARQQFVSFESGLLDDRDLVTISILRQSVVARPAVRMNQAAWGNRRLNEPSKAFGTGIGDAAHPDTANPLPVRLRGDDNQRLFKGLPAINPFLKATEKGLVNFDFAVEICASGTDHGMADFVQPSPRRLVAS